jgi:hypothetical protein
MKKGLLKRSLAVVLAAATAFTFAPLSGVQAAPATTTGKTIGVNIASKLADESATDDSELTTSAGYIVVKASETKDTITVSTGSMLEITTTGSTVEVLVSVVDIDNDDFVTVQQDEKSEATKTFKYNWDGKSAFTFDVLIAKNETSDKRYAGVTLTAGSDTYLITYEQAKKSSGGNGGTGGTPASNAGKGTVKDSAGNTVTYTTVVNKDGTKTVTNKIVKSNGSTVEKTVTLNAQGEVEKVVVVNGDSKGNTTVKATYAMSNGKLTLKKAVVKKASYTVPNTVTVIIDGKETKVKVTAIGKNAIKNNTKIKKLTVGKNIKSIGANAFKGDKNLKTIVLKGKITKIGKNSFKGINKKATIKITSTKKGYKATVKAIKKTGGVAKTVKFKRVK